MTVWRALALIAIGAALLPCGSGCGGRPRLRPLPAGASILAFGDSLTHGAGARDGESYPEVLATLTGRPVINAGRSGEVSRAGLERLPELLARHRPALVVLCHGGNDLLGGTAPEQVGRNLGAMIERCRAADAQVLLLGVPRPSLLLRTHGLYKEVAARYGVPAELDVVADVLSSPALKADQIHPNAAGYRRIAEAVAAMLEG